MKGVIIIAAVPSLLDPRIVAGLQRESFAVVVAPLLTEDEAQFRFDADFLAQRLLDVAQRVARDPQTFGLPIAYVGTSGGGAAALIAAAQRPDLVTAVVSIDGRTDLAIDALRDLRTPTLLIVRDLPVLRMNREALTKMRCERRIEIVHEGEPDAPGHVVQKCVSWLASQYTELVGASV